MHSKEFSLKKFITIVLITSIWVHISEVFRYFVLVRPRVKLYWNHTDGIADMNWIIFGIWGLWDTVLTAMTVFFFWLYAQRFGNRTFSILMAATLSWIFFFVLFWIGAANMGYTNWSLLGITLPLSLFELIIASFIASYLYRRI